MRLTPVIGTTLFFFAAPGLVAGFGPWAITHWRFEPAFAGVEATRFVGTALIFAALHIVIDSFARFALVGEGTPAPISPTRRLVVSGYYRHVRNPMYVGVLAAILGQALLFASVLLLLYAAIVWAAFHAFITHYEEPTLTRTFAEEFREYRANVPRWIPRTSPWRPPAGS